MLPLDRVIIVLFIVYYLLTLREGGEEICVTRLEVKRAVRCSSKMSIRQKVHRSLKAWRYSILSFKKFWVNDYTQTVSDIKRLIRRWYN